MKFTFLWMLGMLLITLQVWAQETTGNNAVKAVTTYDKELAERLGADEFGMKKYVMAFLKKGPDRSQDSITAIAIQKGHMENIGRMAKEGKLLIAGPFLDNGEIRGIYIFNTSSVKEAEELTASDPAIKAGRLIMELHPWYGSAALMEVNSIHEKISGKSLTR